MVPLIPVPFLVLTVSLLIRAENIGATKQKILWKVCSTALVILVCALAWTRPVYHSDYILALLVGLLFSLGGDVALLVRSDRAFLVGMALFLCAHVVYGLTFYRFAGGHALQLPIGFALLLVGLALYFYLYPHLGKMRTPIGIYALVISCMVWAASGSFFGAAFSPAWRWLPPLGALSFYVSDMLLALNRFAHPFRQRPLAVLSTYYAGQLLIALSAAYALL